MKAIAHPPPLRIAPLIMPLAVVPRSASSHVSREPVVETAVLKCGTDHEETEDKAIQRELQEAGSDGTGFLNLISILP